MHHHRNSRVETLKAREAARLSAIMLSALPLAGLTLALSALLSLSLLGGLSSP